MYTTRSNISCTNLGLDTLRQFTQHLVTGRVPQGVIDYLEVIDVDVHEAQRSVRTFGPCDRTLQQVLELHAVWNLGERIDTCQVANSLFQFFQHTIPGPQVATQTPAVHGVIQAPAHDDRIV